jgi:predicted NUDIX family NTP pyrophosphohydrolase
MKRSAGLLLFRRREQGLEVLLVHPGGPFFARKDAGVWSIPKGIVEEGEPARDAAVREFTEETGLAAPASEPVELGEVRQKGGKVVLAWALEGDCDSSSVRSNTFALEWPPGSGVLREFPEIDRAEWFDLGAARVKLNPAQAVFLERLVERTGQAGAR